MEIFRIVVRKDNEKINNISFYTEQMNRLTYPEVLQVFEESFLLLTSPSVKMKNGESCGNWNTSIFESTDQAGNIFNSFVHSRNEIENEISITPCTLGEFINTQYQLLKVNE